MAPTPGRTRLALVPFLPPLLLAAKASSPEYDPAEAALQLQYARASFCDQDSVVEWACGEMCEAAPVEPGSVRTFGPGESSGVQGYVALLPGKSRCVVSFRGSANFANWQTDAQLFLTDWPPAEVAARPCPGCQVHAGFALAYKELRGQVWELSKELACPAVVFTGHSLGAAIATLAAIDFRGSGVHVPAFWSFGSPRVGNARFVDAFVEAAASQGVQRPSWRVVHYHDPVPQGGPTAAFTHVPGEVYYTRRSSDAFEVCGWTAEEPENTTCGLRTLSPMDVIDGLAAGDHVTYLNKTLMIKLMDERCVFTNSCRRLGFFSRGRLIFLTTVVGLLACCAGVLSTLAWQRCRAARDRRRLRVAQRAGDPSHPVGSQVSLTCVA